MVASLAASGGFGARLQGLWRAYERQLRRNPLATQASTSAVLWGMGDLLAQQFEGRQRSGSGLDKRRAVLTAAFGAAVIAPVGHGWYSILDGLCARFGVPGSASFLLAKTILDNALYSPAYVAAFFIYGCMVVDGGGVQDAISKLQTEFLPTMSVETLVYVPLMALIFSKVPSKHTLLAVNTATVFDVAFLSWVRDQEDFLQMLSDGARAPVAWLQQQQQQQWAKQQERQRLQLSLSEESQQPTLGQMALMAASTTCSTCCRK